MFDVAVAGVELLDLGGVDVKAEDGVADLGVAQHQGQTDVAQAEDADLGLLGGEAGEEVHGGGVKFHIHGSCYPHPVPGQDGLSWLWLSGRPHAVRFSMHHVAASKTG